jgi:hypothetical protein
MLQRKVENRAYDVYLRSHEADEAQALQIGEQLEAQQGSCRGWTWWMCSQDCRYECSRKS